MSECYCYEKHRGYTIVVEPLEDGWYEGIAFIQSHHNPVFCFKSDNGEVVRQELIDNIDWLVEESV